jgi:hypothetical protein
MELLQWPLPARACDPVDFAANAVGALVAVAAWVAARRAGVEFGARSSR